MPSSTQPPISEYSILSSYLLNPSPLPQIISYSDFVKSCVPSQHRDHPHVKRLYRDLQFQRDIDIDAVRENIERECRKAGVLRGRLAAKIAIENGSVPTASKKRKRTPSVTKSGSTHVASSGSGVESSNPQDLASDDEEFGHPNSNHAAETMHDASAHPATAALPRKPDQHGFVPQSSHHTTSSLLDALQASIASVKQENHDLDARNDKLFTDLQETIGQLSDLRYGRFARPVSGSGTSSEQESFEDSMVNALQQLESAARRAVERMQ